MRRTLGAQMLSQQLNDLRNNEITLIVRTASDVIYVDLPILVKDLPAGVDAPADAAKASGWASIRPSKRGNRDA